jgi:hypothetical protein
MILNTVYIIGKDFIACPIFQVSIIINAEGVKRLSKFPTDLYTGTPPPLGGAYQPMLQYLGEKYDKGKRKKGKV